LASSGASSASLQEFTLLAAARRSAAAAAAVAAAGVGGGGSGGSHPMSMGVGMPSSGVGPGELHPAYRLNPYTIEHLYSSLHSSPTASLRGLSPLDPRGNKNLALFFLLFLLCNTEGFVQLVSYFWRSLFFLSLAIQLARHILHLSSCGRRLRLYLSLNKGITHHSVTSKKIRPSNSEGGFILFLFLSSFFDYSITKGATSK
jgi:hypothetical protein